jgi:D-3-phosphoglycerate dehydrogenase
MGAFRVAVTADFLKSDGTCGFGDIGLELFDRADIEWEFLRESFAEVPSRVARDYDGLLLLGPRLTAASLAGEPRLKIVARFGVGYDNVDVPACTAAGVLLTITPEGVRRPVAVAALTLLLALSHKLLVKDRLTRAGRWAEKLDYNGQGVTGRTLGILGLGNIGAELAALARPLGLALLAHDPWAKPEAAGALGVRLVALEELLAGADYVCVCCALTEGTRHLLNAERLALMKPNAYLINVARGPIADQQALTAALCRGRIAGAGLDVFETEPIDPHDPLLELDNVILSPHALCWTDECFGANGRSAIGSLIDVAAGRLPKHVVNRAALEHPRWRNVSLSETA